jgi:hypothetical protein
MNYRSPLTHELITKFYYPRPIGHDDPPIESRVIPESDHD